MRGIVFGLVAIGLAGARGPIVAQEAEDFDIDRARVGAGTRFEPFLVKETQPLSDALAAGVVESDTRLLVMEHAVGRLALLTDQMVYHHVAQGDIAGEPWMVSF